MDPYLAPLRIGHQDLNEASRLQCLLAYHQSGVRARSLLSRFHRFLPVHCRPAMHRYLRPAIVLIDELGYLPIDKTGADLLFQIISGRYEHGSTLITSNRVYKRWAKIFNNDSTLTSALLDRLLHHAETIVIEGPSYRGKDHAEPSE